MINILEIILNHTKRIKLAFHRHEYELPYVPTICIACDDASAWRCERTRDAYFAPVRAVTLALYAHFVIWVQAKPWLDKCYLDSAPSRQMVEKWFADFKRGRANTDDAERSGNPN